MRLPRVLAAVATVAVVALVACGKPPKPAAPPGPRPIATPRDLVARMHDTWKERYFRTMVFRQRNTLYLRDGGQQLSEWIEYQSVPRRLRIEFQPGAQKNGILFRANTQYSFTDGRLADERPLVHPLLLLSADVYALPVDTTMVDIAATHIDTTALHQSTWEGRPAYVVGAAEGDSTTSQFWVDAERFVLLRLVQKNANQQGRTVITENRFTYQDVGVVSVPKVITFLRDGRPYWREEYTEVRMNVPLDEAIFDPALWAERFGASSATGS
jgi:hypothetical protein